MTEIAGGTPAKVGGDERVLAILAHLSPILAAVLTAGWLSLVGPLIVWLIWKNHSPLVRTASATSFNFNITIWVAQVLGWILIFVGVVSIVLFPVLGLLGLILLGVPTLLQLIFSIVGAIAAGGGKPFKYPFQVPILRA